MLMEEEAKYGRDLVQGELELVASEWDAPQGMRSVSIVDWMVLVTGCTVSGVDIM